MRPVNTVFAFAALAMLTVLLVAGDSATAYAQEPVESVRLSDAIRSKGAANINLLRDVSVERLEALRLDNNGMLVLAVDVNEERSGTEKAGSQGIAVESVVLTVGFDDGSQVVYDSEGSWFTETQALLAKAGTATRQSYFTLLGEASANRATAGNTFQETFDSTLKIEVWEPFVVDRGRRAVSARVRIVLLETNVALGDPEAYYDFSGGFERLALVSASDAAFLDEHAAGVDEAPLVLRSNPPADIDAGDVASWNYLPSANTFFVVGYEDMYPRKGDYDFNDLSVAYQLRVGLNSFGEAVLIRGSAYLLTRSSGFSHDWRLTIGLPEEAGGEISCVTWLSRRRPDENRVCAEEMPADFSGTVTLTVFEDSRAIFPVSSQFGGPRSEFELRFAEPLDPASVGPAPFDPVLYVRNNGREIHLIEVDAAYKDEEGFPFGMLLTVDWQPPRENIDIRAAYSLFSDLERSEGESSREWYRSWYSDMVFKTVAPELWAW